MWVALAIVAALAVVWGLLVARAAAMNRDPTQQELAHLIMEMMASGADEDAQLLFTVSSTRALMMAAVDPGERQTRLAHALSMVKPVLNPLGYETARRIIRQMD